MGRRHQALRRTHRLIALAAALAAGIASAQNFPARPLRIIVPQSAGGSTDLPARALAASVPAALAAGDAAASRGGDVPAIVAAVTGYLAQHGLTADYVEVTDPDLGPAPANGPCRLLAAVPVAGVRLLDNIPLVLGASS